MVSLTRCIVLGFVSQCLAQGGLVLDPKHVAAGSHVQSVRVDISPMVNNRAFAMSEGDADFDGSHAGYPAQYIPPPELTYAGVDYTFPQYNRTPGGFDNVLALGQSVNVPRGRYLSVHMLAASETAIATSVVNATYADGSTGSSAVLVHAFRNQWTPFGGDIIFPYTLEESSVDYNRSMIFRQSNWLDSSKELVSLQLPNVTNKRGHFNTGQLADIRLHIFALSLIPVPADASSSRISLEVEYARTTQMWIEGTNKTQIVEVTINNVGKEWVLANNSVVVTVDSPGLHTEVPAVLHRLRPGDQTIVQVGVVTKNGTAVGTTSQATVRITGVGVSTTSTFTATHGIVPYESTYESIYTHESPQWFNNAKFGILIHWGPYSVPGWGNSAPNEVYSEWYWWDLGEGPNNPTWQYHRDTFGPNVTYDDFIPMFTASAFDPKEWVDLFADAGATYFVPVTKHHDGYAIFDNPANVSRRTSVAQFPHRDLLKELFDAAKQHQPQLHRATYFSLPEWYSPAYEEYGFFRWPGGPPTDPFSENNEVLPYTGYVPVNDFIRDIQLPQMQILAEMGSEMMWCDIGGRANCTADFAAEYFNRAAQDGRQVLMNNRCALPGDIDTPEYARYDAIQPRKWESNLGMDPFSFAYNRATPESAYMTAQTLITALVDITSKNGNLLIDIGPKADGTILDVEQRNLRAAGKWLKGHAEAIYNTTYWFLTPEEGVVRFTQTPEAFYILTLSAPNSTLLLNSPVPYVRGDQITVVGGRMHGTVIPSQLLHNGSLQLTISSAVAKADEYSWVFKIPYGVREQTSQNETGNATPAAARHSPLASALPVQNADRFGGPINSTTTFGLQLPDMLMNNGSGTRTRAEHLLYVPQFDRHSQGHNQRHLS